MVEIGGFAVFVDTERYGKTIAASLLSGKYEARERDLACKMLRRTDRVLEAGTAIGVVAMTAAAIVGAASVLTFDANPDIVADARENFRRNGLAGIHARIGALRNRAGGGQPGDTVAFHIMKEFWASRMVARPDDADLVKTVYIPWFCLEDEIAGHGANVLICDIEGAEVALLMQADLAPIRMIIMETHYWAAGEAATDALLRKLIGDGFSMHLGHPGHHVLVLRR